MPPLPLAQLRHALDRASQLTNTPLLLSSGASTQVSTFVHKHLGVSPGSKCMVITPPSPHAAPILHYLRRGGYFPLAMELPDNSPTATYVASAVASARRTGVSFVVGVGSSSVLSVARGVAALLPSGGSVMDYATGLGGKGVLSPSLPLLSVPTCPSGLELCREALLLVEGHTLAGLRSHPDSVQAALVDPALAKTLGGEAALGTAWGVLAHAAEAYLRPDSGLGGRDLAWLALELSSRAFLVGTNRRKGGGNAAATKKESGWGEEAEEAATALAAASALVSAALAEGPLGPCRGLALSIATRYSIPYSTALLAVTPRVFAAPAEAALAAYEEMAQELEGEGEGGGGWEWDDEQKGEGGGRKGKLGGRLPKPKGMFPAGKKGGEGERKNGGGGSEAAASTPEARAAEKREEEEEDKELERLVGMAGREMAGLDPYGGERSSGNGSSGGSSGSGGGAGYKASDELPLSEEEEDSELVQAARRYAHVGTLLADVLAAAGAAGGGGSAGSLLPLGATATPSQPLFLQPWEPVASVARRVRLDSVGRARASELGATLEKLALAGAVGVGQKAAPCLDDYGLTDADLEAVAEMAEVDDNTLNTVITFKRRDLLNLLKGEDM